MISTMKGCVAHNGLRSWPISSRSFGLDLENRVRSVASTVLDGFFLYLAQMITIIRGCVACFFWPCPWKKNLQFSMDSFYLAQMITNMRGCVAYNYLWPWPIYSRSELSFFNMTNLSIWGRFSFKYIAHINELIIKSQCKCCALYFPAFRKCSWRSIWFM